MAWYLAKHSGNLCHDHKSSSAEGEAY